MPSAFSISGYKRIIEVLNTPTGSAVTTLSDFSSGTDKVINAEFDLQRQGGCGGGTFHLDMGFEETAPLVGQWIRCSYSTGDHWYLGRIESVSQAEPSGVELRTFGVWAAITEVQVGGQPWWDTTSPQTFGKYDYFTSDPDHAVQVYTNIANMQAFINILYTDYIASWPGGTTGLASIVAPDTDGSFSSMTFRGGESLAQVIRSLADCSGNASYGINADNEFFFIPLNTSSQATFKDGDTCDLKKSQDRSNMYNRIAIDGGYIYGETGNPGFYQFAYHQEDATSIATYGAKTLAVKMPWIRSFVDAQNFCNGFLGKYKGVTTKYTVSTTAVGSVVNPWDGYVTLQNTSGTSLGSHAFDSVKVTFNEAPVLEITTGPQIPLYPGSDILQNQTGENTQGGGGGGGDQRNVSGFIGNSMSMDSCDWPPCQLMDCGFVVTSAHPSGGYVIGDIYYSTHAFCPRTGITFYDMENPIGQYANLGDSGLTPSDYHFRVGTAKYMRYFADHDINGCKWFLTGLYCP